MYRQLHLFVISIVSICCGGCGFGYDRVFFATKSTAAIEFDSVPPTVGINVGRIETVVAPSFDAGKQPPVVAAFRFESKLFVKNYLGSVFTTGDAAATVARHFTDRQNVPVDQYEHGEVLISQTPKRWDNGAEVKLLKPGQVRPVFFVTETSLGLKASWAEMTAAVPSSFHFGYVRKELALPPVTMEELSEEEKAKHPGMSYKVGTPSLLATLDGDTAITTPAGTGLALVQYFATGSAATNLACRAEIRDALARRIDPGAYAQEYGLDDNKLALGKYIKTPANREKVVEWLKKNNINATPEDVVLDVKHKAIAAQIVKDLSITP